MTREAAADIGALLAAQLDVIDPPPGATLIPDVEIGSERWLSYMTASKIAAAVGLSTYESPFSLWHRMSGLIPPDPDDDMKRRGHYLEPAIRAWFADQHPDWDVETTGTWVRRDRPWQAASPDALVYPLGDSTPFAVAEFKSAHEDDDWGTPGTDEIPVWYRCQAMWQMDTIGVDACHVAVLTRHLEFAEYVVGWDQAEAQILIDAAARFMASLAAGQRPDIDAHSQTYQAIRLMHPDIGGEDVELDDDLAARYCTARAALKAAEAEERLARSLVADALGSARRARHQKRTIAQRQAKGGGVPYVVAGRNLPTFTTKAAAS